ncbi:MAG TPA: hypothetical protein VHC97_09275 [Thermoanaerobaculia bacterium]|jgi:hypothetical protein|nr:hypothetical protein [Thermoanaerobaculia bacterium]
MSKTLSVSDMLANLEARISRHRERREIHAREEAHHREQCAFHDAELAKILERYDAFKMAADAASDYAHPRRPRKVCTCAKAGSVRVACLDVDDRELVAVPE